MIVIVAGLPGSGKSFFAERLAEKLDAVYLNSDKIRQELNASRRYSLADKLVVYNEMLQRSRKIIDIPRHAVVDGTFFNHIMREMFIGVSADLDVPLVLIEVVADEKLIRERLTKPRKYSEADFSAYETVRDEFEEITMPHLVLESTNDNLDKMLSMAIEYINLEH